MCNVCLYGVCYPGCKFLLWKQEKWNPRFLVDKELWPRLLRAYLVWLPIQPSWVNKGTQGNHHLDSQLLVSWARNNKFPKVKTIPFCRIQKVSSRAGVVQCPSYVHGFLRAPVHWDLSSCGQALLQAKPILWKIEEKGEGGHVVTTQLKDGEPWHDWELAGAQEGDELLSVSTGQKGRHLCNGHVCLSVCSGLESLQLWLHPLGCLTISVTWALGFCFQSRKSCYQSHHYQGIFSRIEQWFRPWEVYCVALGLWDQSGFYRVECDGTRGWNDLPLVLLA